MIINVDAKALEWLGAVYLSKDPTGYDEIRHSIDQHSHNQAAFGLPSRLIAKKFVFRLIYGGSSYSYANDSDFEGVSTEEGFWQEVIDRFYQKYIGVAEWHEQLINTVMKTGCLEIPTGRRFVYTPEKTKTGVKWPRTTILNYPVQAFGADLMVLARRMLWKSLFGLRKECLWSCTVHDSIVWDCRNDLVDEVVGIVYDTWGKIPEEFGRVFKVEFDLPCVAEVSVGPNWGDLTEIKNAN